MTIKDNPKLPGIERKLPKSVGSFELKECNDEHGMASVKYNVDNATLALKVSYDTQSGELEAYPLASTPFLLILDKERGPNACPRRYTEEFGDGESAYEGLKRVISLYEKRELYEEDDYHYFSAVTFLLHKYAADICRQVRVKNWPSDLLERNLGLYDKDTEQLVADFDIRRGDRDIGFLIVPPNYTPPTQEPPLAEIEDPNNLPEPGQIVYQIFDIVSFIGISPHPENTNMRKVRGLLRELHIDHGYHIDLAWQGLLEAAQRQGVLTETDREEDRTDAEGEGNQSKNTSQDQYEKSVEDWF